ncbi:MAG: hypothetical protein AAGD25_28140 [Cyanobacteria bacterium P01_F01_bin.150]
MPHLFGTLLLIVYIGGVWKFWTGFSQTNFNRGSKWYLGALWPVLLFNASYRQNFSKALKGR